MTTFGCGTHKSARVEDSLWTFSEECKPVELLKMTSGSVPYIASMYIGR